MARQTGCPLSSEFAIQRFCPILLLVSQQKVEYHFFWIQETSETKSDEFELKTNVLAFASRSKLKSKPRKTLPLQAHLQALLICERFWTDIEPGTYSNIAFPVSKRMTTLLRHGPLPRGEDGAIEFWRLKDYLRNEFENSQYWLVWCNVEEQDSRRRRQQEKISILY